MGQTTIDGVRRLVRDYDLAFPGVVFAAHCFLVSLVAALATRYAYALPEVKAVGYRLPQLNGWRGLLIEPLRNWDGFWYGLIAEQGYQFHPATTAFWPLYPWTMRFTADSFGIEVETAGLLLSNIAFAAALVVLYRLVTLECDESVARRSVLLLAFFPTAFFFSAVYSESFFLLFTLLAFWWARTGKWWHAGLAGFLAALTRNVGVLLVIPLGLMWVEQHGWYPRRWNVRAVALALPPAGASVYLIYLKHIYGNALLTLDVQAGWGRIRAMPWETARMAFDQVRLGWLHEIVLAPGWSSITDANVRFSFSEYESLDIAVTLVAIPLIVLALMRLPRAWGIYTAIVFVLPLFSPSTIHPLMSTPRFVLVLFPLFVALATIVRRPLTFAVVIASSSLMLCALTVQFATWFWVA